LIGEDLFSEGHEIFRHLNVKEIKFLLLLADCSYKPGMQSQKRLGISPEGVMLFLFSKIFTDA